MPRVKVRRRARRVFVSILGGSLIVAGLLLIPLPGPLTIPPVLLGLTILSWEFRWAKRALFEARRKWRRVKRRSAKRHH